jgi:hypothetical protein
MTMTAEMNLKLKAFVAALSINAMLLGGAAYMFDGQIHRSGHFADVVKSVVSEKAPAFASVLLTKV